MQSLTYVQKFIGRFSKGFVLAFHDIAAEQLERFVDALHPIRPVHLSELTSRSKARKSTEGLCAITIDDGVGKTVRELSALFRARRWPASFFLPTAYVDTGEGFAFQWWRQVRALLPVAGLDDFSGFDLSTPTGVNQLEKYLESSWHIAQPERYTAQIMELARTVAQRRGIALDDLRPPAPVSWAEVASLSKDDLIHFESHGVSHVAMSAFSEEEIEAEMLLSRDTVSEHTGRPCLHLAYPFGSQRSIGTLAPRIARQFYESAVTMDLGYVDGADPWILPRLPLYPENSVPFAQMKVLAKCTALNYSQAAPPAPFTPAVEIGTRLSTPRSSDNPR
jgi:peptidoglycan/xylan/chitin deacetylase (PgdA/CDA1 family)